MKVPLLASVFSQQASPRLWLLAQRLIGGTPDKQAILRNQYQGEKRVVEIGCSIGNVARILLGQPDLSYLGLDIDEGALAFARQWYAKHPAFGFANRSFQDLAAEGAEFDLVCVTGVLHHVPDNVAQQMLDGARAVLAPSGRVLMFDPIPLRAGDGPVYGLIHRLEQGEYLRDPATLRAMMQKAGFIIDHEEEVAIGPGATSWPKIMSLSVMTGRAA
ncbi:MAG: class I SAM-dependent methyltransferase [Rhodobacteraceae bacterium]|nr:class I SAM-dependent methyltransferase [Paracoccaceae bacterium]